MNFRSLVPADVRPRSVPSPPPRRESAKDAAILLVLVVLNVALQSWTNGRRVFVLSDEGVYLYTARLLVQGAVPYRDVFLAQPPALIYAIGGLIKLSPSVDVARTMLAVWFSAAFVPIYLVVRKSTRSRSAAALACFFYATFAELVQWDAHSFALRQMSLPLLASAIYFVYARPRPRTAGVLLGLFALCILSNALVAGALLLAVAAGDTVRAGRTLGEWARARAPLVVSFAVVVLLGYAATFAIPGSFENLVGYQLERESVPIRDRLAMIEAMAPRNWPILVWGLLGSLVLDEELGLFGLFNWGALAVAVLGGRAFYEHYLSILGVGLAVSAGVLAGRFGTSRSARVLVAMLALGSVSFASFSHLRSFLVERTTPDFYDAVRALEAAPEPVFAVEPIYAIYARKELTFHYHVADMRYFTVLHKTLDEATYLALLEKSRSVLIEPFAKLLLPPRCLEYIALNFRLAHRTPNAYIFIR